MRFGMLRLLLCIAVAACHPTGTDATDPGESDSDSDSPPPPPPRCDFADLAGQWESSRTDENGVVIEVDLTMRASAEENEAIADVFSRADLDPPYECNGSLLCVPRPQGDFKVTLVYTEDLCTQGYRFLKLDDDGSMMLYKGETEFGDREYFYSLTRVR